MYQQALRKQVECHLPVSFNNSTAINGKTMICPAPDINKIIFYKANGRKSGYFWGLILLVVNNPRGEYSWGE